MADDALRAEGLRLGYRSHVVVHDVDVGFPAGQITAIVGSNGCGKSTLLRGLGRLLPTMAGRVLLDGDDVSRLGRRELGRRLAMLPQGPVAPDGITVIDMVARGRYAHQGWVRSWSSADEHAVASALDLTSCTGFATAALDELSGGQRQRVWIAMAIAQASPVMLLDEPITFLDVAHQVEVLDLLTDLNVEQNRTIVMVLHDLNLAARYAHRIVAVKDGRVHRVGRPDEVITAEVVQHVFGLRCRVVTDEVAGTPCVLPMGRHRAPPGADGPSVTSPSPTPDREGTPCAADF